MTARELEAVASDLARRRNRAREAVRIAGACALSAPAAGIAVTSAPAAAAAPFVSTIAISLAVGASLSVLVAIVSLLAYREAVARMALDPSAYVLPEIRRYGGRFATPAKRSTLAVSLREVIHEAGMPQCWCLGDRVANHAEALESLASDLARPQALVRPASAVACNRLLTHGADSPLYNPAIPAAELGAVITRIRLGIDEPHP